MLPATVFVFFFRKYLRGEAPRIDRVLVFAFLASRVLIGLSSGWLGTVVWPGVICILVYIAEGRPIPVKTAALVLGCVLFLQVGKEAFRGVYWGGATEGTTSERVQFWIEQSASKWAGAIHGDDSAASGNLASQTLSRLSLLTAAAHVLDWTPDTVPYQYGHTYSYLFVTLVPRFLWPEKPSMSEANQFYQVQYGLTTENNLASVSIAVGFLTEGYINFGWFGVAGVAYFVGLVLGIFQRTFLRGESGLLLGSIGLALIPGFLTIESQLAQYFSGVVQQVVLTLLILLPVIRRRVGNLPRNESTGEADGSPDDLPSALG
jgi:predicted small integral membrane protein